MISTYLSYFSISNYCLHWDFDLKRWFVDCFPLFHWWKNFSERNTNCFLPTSIFFFALHTFYIYICNPQKEVIISWICCCDDLVISREKVHMMNSHFFYMLAFDWLGFPDFFFIKIKPSYNFLQVYAIITTTRPHPFNLVQNSAADFELVSN